METSSRFPLLLRTVLPVVLALISACGGGSSGTGTTTRVFEGTVLTISDHPVAGAVVTVVATGDSAVTGPDGRFSIATPAGPGDADLQIQAPGVDASVVVPALSDDASTVKLNVTVDPASEAATVNKFEVVSRIAGACSVYFVNDQVLLQTAPVPAGVRCTLKVWVNLNGVPQARVKFGLQYRSCDENAPWITLDTGTTFTGVHSGVGQLGFNFFDDPEHCVYRVVTPYEDLSMEGVVQEIRTLTAQGADSRGQ